MLPPKNREVPLIASLNEVVGLRVNVLTTNYFCLRRVYKNSLTVSLMHTGVCRQKHLCLSLKYMSGPELLRYMKKKIAPCI